MNEAFARIEAERIGKVDRVAVNVGVRLLGLVDERINADELPCLGVVVAPD